MMSKLPYMTLYGFTLWSAPSWKVSSTETIHGMPTVSPSIHCAPKSRKGAPTFSISRSRRSM